MGSKKLLPPNKAPSKLSSVTRKNWNFTITWKNPKNCTSGTNKWEDIYVRVSIDTTLDTKPDIGKKKVTTKTKNKKGKIKKKKVKSTYALTEKNDKVKVFKLKASETKFNIHGNGFTGSMQGKKPSNTWLHRNNYKHGWVRYDNGSKQILTEKSGAPKIDSIIFEVQPWNSAVGKKKKPDGKGLVSGVPSVATSFFFDPPSFKGSHSINIGKKEDDHVSSVSVDYDTDQASRREIQAALWSIKVTFYYWDSNSKNYKSIEKDLYDPKVRVENGAKFERTKSIKPNDLIRGFNVPGHNYVLDLTPGEGLKIESTVTLYGVQGDTTSFATKNIAYPWPVQISKNGIDVSDSYMYIIRFETSTRGEDGIYNSEKYVLEMLRSYRPDGSDRWNNDQWLAAAKTEDSGWKEVYTVGPTEKAFCHNKQKARPEKYARTFYRIRSDNDAFDSIYSDPQMVPDFVQVPNPKDEKVKFLEAIATDDGKSIKITYGWRVTTNADGEANSDGTELSWSPDEYAWRSNQKPDTLNMLDDDFIDDEITVATLNDVEKRPAWAGDMYMGNVALMFDMPPRSNVRYFISWNKSSLITEAPGCIYITGTNAYREPIENTTGFFDWSNEEVSIVPTSIQVLPTITSNYEDEDHQVILGLVHLVCRTTETVSPLHIVWQQHEDSAWKTMTMVQPSNENEDESWQDWSWDSAADAVLASFHVNVQDNVASIQDQEPFGYPLTSDILLKGDKNLVDKIGTVYLRGLSEGTPYYLKLRRSLTEGLEETMFANTYSVYTGNTLDASDEVVALRPSSKPTNLTLIGPDAIAEGDDLSLTWTFESTGEQTEWMILYAKPYEDGDGSEDKDVDIMTESPLEEDSSSNKQGDEDYEDTAKMVFSNPMPLYHTVGNSAGVPYSNRDARGYAVIEYEDLENLIIDGKVYLAVRVQTTGAYVVSNILSIPVSKAPTLDVIDFPTEINNLPLTFDFRSSVGTLDVKLTIRAEASYLWKPDGPEPHVNGQVVYSVYLRSNDKLQWTEEQDEEETDVQETSYLASYTVGDLTNLHDMGRYTVEVEGIDSETGLSTTYNLPEGVEAQEYTFEVNWSHQADEPSERSYILKNPKGLGVDIYIRSTPNMVETDVCDVYRVTPDGAYLVLEGQPFDTMVTDMYAPFSNTAFTRYRLCTRTIDGDIAWRDIGYRLKETCIRLDWASSTGSAHRDFETGLSLPYNVRLSDSLEKNFEARLHMNGLYSGYWNSGIKRTASLSTDIIKVQNPEEKEKIRALGRYNGPVYVRTPDGCAYTANVSVKTIPYEYNSQIMAIQLDAVEIAMAEEFMIEKNEKILAEGETDTPPYLPDETEEPLEG